MIITCNNCNKNFKIDSNLIPEKGRLLQCSSCNYQWFFKKETINKILKAIDNDKSDQLTIISQSDVLIETKKLEEKKENENAKSIKLLDETFKDDSILETALEYNTNHKDKYNNTTIDIIKKKKNYNILSLTIIFIISFISLILVLDTFQYPISKIFPNVEFLLYNLYETINDIRLFLKDLT